MHDARRKKLQELFASSPHARLNPSGMYSLPAVQLSSVLVLFFCHHPLLMDNPASLNVLQGAGNDAFLDVDHVLAFLERAGGNWLEDM